MNELHLFAGAGGGILGGQLLGHSTVCAVEIEEYPRQVLLQRQRDGVLPRFPIWDDVCTFDGKPWRGTVDVICGGFPCQDISSAGKGAGIAGKRSGLWTEYARIIDEVRPKFVFAENSPLLRGRGLDVVLGDLSELGYDAKWCVLGAWHVGAPHKRNRMWVLAYPMAHDGNKATKRWREGCYNTLTSQVFTPAMWPTPATRDYKGGHAPRSLTRKDGKTRMDILPNVVAYGGKTTQQLSQAKQDCCKRTLQLNPAWVEWLMGWPVGWTDLKLLETGKYQQWQQLHGIYFHNK